jgi:tRNA (guanine-N7-)-methyltransferase
MDAVSTPALTGGEPEGHAPFQRRTVSFTRLDGRLNARHQGAWDRYARDFLLDVPRGVARTSVAPGYRLDPMGTFGRQAPLVLEIGAGAGDAVVHAALAHPERDFLAVEVYRPGVAQTLAKVGSRGLSNVRVVQADAVEVLRTMLAPGAVAEVWVFFPDPWHKARHHKRRLVSPQLADLVAECLEPGGRWRLATDWADYAMRMRDVGSASPLFTNRYAGRLGLPGDAAGGFAPRFDGRVMTRFERKGLAVGRATYDLCFERVPRGSAGG